MNHADYAYAVGRIRANEPKLLSKQDYEQLITATDKATVIRLLTDKGWPLPEQATAEDAAKALDDTWRLICECTPDSDVLNALIIKNDFANLKAAIKAFFSDLDPTKYFSTPCTVKPTVIAEAVTQKQFDALPEFLQEPCRKAYEAITQQQSGQLAEAAIDKASLTYRVAVAQKADSALLNNLMAFECAEADIKVALRCLRNHKSSDFLKHSLCDTTFFDKHALADNADSVESIAAFIESTPLAFLADAVREGFTTFENVCTDYRIQIIEGAKWEIFSPDPLIAYWVRKVNEVRNARIILSAKENALNIEEIRKRVRGTDV